MANSSFKNFIFYLVRRNKWWMWLVVLFSLVVGVIIVATQSTAIAPFIYPIF